MWARHEGRPVFFAEFGQRRAAFELQAWPDGMAHPAVDARALLETTTNRPWFAGTFVWRYDAGPMDASLEKPRDFSPRGREREEALRQLYDPRLAWGADPCAGTRPRACAIDG